MFFLFLYRYSCLFIVMYSDVLFFLVGWLLFCCSMFLFLSIVSYGISYLLFDVAFIVICCSYYIEVVVTNTTRLGASINVMKRVWLSFYMYILIESMGFLALFVPLFNSNLTCYLMEPNALQVYTILMSTAILLSSGYLTNIAAWALFTYQTYIIIVARLLCVIAAFSFILIECHELQTSTPAFNTSCLHSSIVTLEVFHLFHVWCGCVLFVLDVWFLFWYLDVVCISILVLVGYVSFVDLVWCLLVRCLSFWLLFS
uniref:Cytochrome c oxidase subunit 3 n=1 Tax=Perkinsela sp. GillNOR1/I TaxID=1766904 RepID=A0A0U2UBM5_9EUGL|nr:cytochrome c oxidase subunit 3 [Perkinsela sp. GillNOR1/I]